MPTSTLTSTLTSGIVLGSGRYAATLTIAPSGAVTASAGTAVYIAPGTTLDNYGLVSGYVRAGAATGQSATARLVNAGSIAAPQGIDLFGNAAGVNLGAISGVLSLDTSVPFTNQGDITGAVYVTTSGLTNSGSIGLTGKYLWVSGGSVSNSGSIALGSGTLKASNSTLTNSGSISGGTVYLLGATLTNTGTITTPLRLQALASGNGAALVNDGVILGTVTDLKADTITNGGTMQNLAVTGAAALFVTPGAAFTGTVTNASQAGTLVLGGSTQAMLDVSSFSGFSTIDFSPTSQWTLAGSAAQLGNGAVLNGFHGSDELVLQGFPASSGSYFAGTGLVLANATGSVTLDLTTAAFTSSADAVTLFAQPLATITGTVTTKVETGSGPYANTLTIAAGATLATSTYPTLYLQAGGTVFNAGLVSGFIKEGAPNLAGQPEAMLVNTGTLATGQDGLWVNTGESLQNNGLIIGNNLAVDGSLTNAGTVSIPGYGFEVTTQGQLDNTGLITGSGTGLTINALSLTSNTGMIYGATYGVVMQNVFEGLNNPVPSSLLNSGTIGGGTDALLASNLFNLTVTPGAVFAGAVVDEKNLGTLALAGTTAGMLDISSFSGFSHISFASGTWTLDGTAAQLATGQSLVGFGTADTLVLESFAATSGSYIAGTGMVLSNTSGSVTLNVNANSFSSDGTATTLRAGPTLAPTATLTTTVTSGVTLDSAAYAATLTITGMGAIIDPTGVALAVGARDTALNAGTITGTVVNAGALILNSQGFYTKYGAYLVNSGALAGNVTVGLGTLTNTGSINATVTVNDGTLDNTGVLLGPVSAWGIAADLIGFFPGSIANSGTLNGGSLGVTLNALSRLDNTGLILGPVQLNGGSFSNSGSLITSGTAIAMGRSNGTWQGAYVLDNSGLISGSVDAVYSTLAMVLSVTGGAMFTGAVVDAAGLGTLALGGVAPGTLDVSSFSGFDEIDFAPGSRWTLEGSLTQFAQGETINGFTAGDTLVLDSLAATLLTVSSFGLLLSDFRMLDITGNFSAADFTVTDSNGSTTIVLGGSTTVSNTISTITGTITSEVETGISLYAATLTVAAGATVASGSYPTLYIQPGDTVRNEGLISGFVKEGITALASQQPALLANYGTLATGYNGLQVNVDDSLQNNGIILGNNLSIQGSLYNGGTISIPNYNLELGFNLEINATGQLNNTGLITANGRAVTLDSLNRSTNSGTMSATTYGVVALNWSAGGGNAQPAALYNSGTIAGGTDAILAYNQFDLTVAPGAVFTGAVVDKADEGTLVLGGFITAGRLDISSFSGFSDIIFASTQAEVSPWRLAGTAAQLASGETISGFTLGDALVLEGVSASSGSFASAGTFVLAGGTTLDLGNVSAVQVQTDGTNTTLIGKSTVTITPSANILDTILSSPLTLIGSTSLSSFTITPTGEVSGNLFADGTIELDNQGILLTGASLVAGATLVNTGTVDGYVKMGSGSDVINHGLITGLADGIDALSGSLLIENTGTIRSDTSNGIAGSYGGTILNSGYVFGFSTGIIARADLCVNTGTIVSSINGVVMSPNTSFVNTGLISGTGFLVQGALVGGSGIFIGTAIAVNNSGTIIGNVCGAVGEANTSLTNSGMISGGTYGVGDVQVLTNTGLITGGTVGVRLNLTNAQVTNSGTISGGKDAIYANAAGFTLTALTGAVFGGAVDDATGNGTLVLASGNGSLDIDSFSGFSTIDFAPGSAWTLEGTSAQFATGEIINGFGSGDTLVLEGVSASAGSFVSGTGFIVGGDTLDLPGSVAIATDGTNTTLTAAACFCPGTRIATPRGEVAVEALRIGDEVLTLHDGAQPVKWIGHRHYTAPFSGGDLVRPVTVRAGALGDALPRADLHISPGHALYLEGALVHAWRLLNGRSICQPDAEAVRYIHLEFDRQQVIFAEGAAVESFHGSAFRAQFQNAAEFAALYPGHKDTPTRYSHLEGGFALAALQARLGRIPARPANGPLRGFIDRLTPSFVQGWAQDETAPEIPVVLSVYAGAVFLGRVLANTYRPDLRLAGIGDGCHGFEFALPAGIRGEITFRRNGQPAALPRAA